MKQSDVTTDIAIIGGGICGLTTALALERQGFSPTVYEAASEYRPVGAGILLQTNALLVFERLGIADRVLSAGVSLDDTRILSASGRTLKRFDLDDVERTHFGYGYVAIHRGDLQQILLAELDSPVKTGKVCAAVEDTDSPVAQFEDGTRIQPDILVGADGINSNVRDAIVPDIELRTLNTTVFRAITTCRLPEYHRARGLEIWGDGTYTGGSPIDDDRFYWFATVSNQLETVTTDPKNLPEKLHRYYKDFPEPVPTVINSFDPDENIITTGLRDVPPLDNWSRGSVVLAGDAAHGMLPFAGQGAAQAIEDAIAFAAALNTHAEHTVAFEAYERERKQRADQIRSESHWLGKLGATQSKLGCRVRNYAANLVPKGVFRRLRYRRVTETTLPDSFVPEPNTQ